MSGAKELGRDEAEAIAERLRSLAAAARLQILSRLQAGEASVGELERRTGLKQPGLSQQLAELRQAGWVSTRREARSVVYRLADPRTETLIAALFVLLAEGGDAASLVARLGAPGTSAADPGRPVEAAVFARAGGRAA